MANDSTKKKKKYKNNKNKIDDPLFNEQPTERTQFEIAFNKFDMLVGITRYVFLSHRSSQTDKEILIGSLTSLILLDITCMTFYSSNIYYAITQDYNPFEFTLVFAPFPFAIIISPFLSLFLVIYAFRFIILVPLYHHQLF
jgi:hypothetical protein